MKDLFTQIVPLDVADQDRLGLVTQVQLGQMAGRLDHLPDIIVGQSDRHHLLLVPVDHGRNAALPAQPPDSPRAGPLILRRVARLDPYLQCFRHRSIALTGPAARRGPQNGKKGQRGATSTRTRTTLEPAIPTRDRLSLSLAVAKSKNAVPGTAQ